MTLAKRHNTRKGHALLVAEHPRSARISTLPWELQAIVDDQEDLYESFSGPGLEVVDQLSEEIQRRLAGTQS